QTSTVSAMRSLPKLSSRDTLPPRRRTDDPANRGPFLPMKLYASGTTDGPVKPARRLQVQRRSKRLGVGKSDSAGRTPSLLCAPRLVATEWHDKSKELSIDGTRASLGPQDRPASTNPPRS